MGRGVEAVIFDWGGTLTPWHEVDLPEQWRVYAREVHGVPLGSPDVPQPDLAAAHDLADRIMRAEAAAWKRGREDHSSAAIAEILDAAGVDARHDRHLLALAAYRTVLGAPHRAPTPRSGRSGRGCTPAASRSASCPTPSGPATTTGRSSSATGSPTSSTATSTHRRSTASSRIPTPSGPPATPWASLPRRPCTSVTGSSRTSTAPTRWGCGRSGSRTRTSPRPSASTSTAVPDAVAHELLDVLAIVDGWRAGA